MNPLHGVVPIVPIPFDDNENIDYPSLRRAVEWIAAQRFTAMCLPAYASEFYKLSEGEREEVVGAAIQASAGRVPVIAQANHGSPKVAAETARRYERLGASAISFAIPRMFATGNDDLLRYCGQICDAVALPILIQDFNPGRPSIDADFMAELARRHANFRYVKLEEPMLPDKLERIRDRLGDRVGVLEGWGGYYMLEAIPVGAIGIMPGLAIADLLQRVFILREKGDNAAAYDLFGSVLPFISFTLQDLELFLQVEKRLLVKRGLFSSPRVRSLSLSLSPALEAHAAYMIDQILRIIG